MNKSFGKIVCDTCFNIKFNNKVYPLNKIACINLIPKYVYLRYPYKLQVILHNDKKTELKCSENLCILNEELKTTDNFIVKNINLNNDSLLLYYERELNKYKICNNFYLALKSDKPINITYLLIIPVIIIFSVSCFLIILSIVSMSFCY